ncbi:hypothetical protein Tco_0508820, partial [Tanacetum coccineum]
RPPQLHESTSGLPRLKLLLHSCSLATNSVNFTSLIVFIKGGYHPRFVKIKRTSISAAPAMTQAAIRKLVADSVSAALEAQAATMANAKNTNRNTRQGEALVWKALLASFAGLNELNQYFPVELAVLCPTMVPNSEKLMEVFIGGLPISIEGNVTASKPQTLEEAITITQRLMDQVTKHNSVQGTNDHK